MTRDRSPSCRSDRRGRDGDHVEGGLVLEVEHVSRHIVDNRQRCLFVRIRDDCASAFVDDEARFVVLQEMRAARKLVVMTVTGDDDALR